MNIYHNINIKICNSQRHIQTLFIAFQFVCVQSQDNKTLKDSVQFLNYV